MEKQKKANPVCCEEPSDTTSTEPIIGLGRSNMPVQSHDAETTTFYFLQFLPTLMFQFGSNYLVRERLDLVRDISRDFSDFFAQDVWYSVTAALVHLLDMCGNVLASLSSTLPLTCFGLVRGTYRHDQMRCMKTPKLHHHQEHKPQLRFHPPTRRRHRHHRRIDIRPKQGALAHGGQEASNHIPTERGAADHGGIQEGAGARARSGRPAQATGAPSSEFILPFWRV